MFQIQLKYEQSARADWLKMNRPCCWCGAPWCGVAKRKQRSHMYHMYHMYQGKPICPHMYHMCLATAALDDKLSSRLWALIVTAFHLYYIGWRSFCFKQERAPLVTALHKYTCTLSEDRSRGNAGISRKCKAKNLQIVLEETT
jgi:hypothetical protein